MPQASRSSPSRLATVLCGAAFAGAFILTHLPPPPIHVYTPFNDEVLHFVGFFILAGLTFRREAPPGIALPSRRRRLILFLWLILHAVFDETTQELVGRDLEAGDLLADALGAAAGLFLTARLLARRRPAT